MQAPTEHLPRHNIRSNLSHIPIHFNISSQTSNLPTLPQYTAGQYTDQTSRIFQLAFKMTATLTNGSQSHSVEETGLFSADLISPAIAAQLPGTYTLRALRKSDYARCFLDCLRVLTVVGDITEEQWDQRYEWMNGQGRGGYYLLVIDDGERIVGTGALIVERKFIHNLGLVGHIEDIAVAKDQQGKKLGLKLIQALDFIAEKVGCYKTILDCSEANEGFYVKCGFKRAGLEMAHYYEGPKSS
ncbi:glucosamine 6-phosphate acetyltransferase [Calycina marina]|uniref:Glucosamine 6-phosphate N-acetyltransferase n=1 Tax=Calycina marina TaxID=1763456 RepID=A0A9P7YUV7_9HELO|nr:glucosamine 6-phosphate acetyltransferase [Calycina marina]